MRFLLDESVNARIRPFMQGLGHDVTGIAREHPASLDDSDVLSIAFRERRILITNDRDFGRLVFVEGHSHAGVIYFRLGPSPPLAILSARLDEVLSRHAHELDQFIVVTHHQTRIRR